MIPHFTHVWALLLLPVGLLPLWLYVRHSRGAYQYSDSRLVPALVSLRVRWAKWGGLGLRVAGLALAIVALSGPRWVDESRRIPTEGISIAMMVDVSVSMGTEDFVWGNETLTRLVGVKKVFRLFVEGGTSPDGVELKGRPNDAVALIPFGTHPETACPATLDHATLLKIMEAQETRIGANEGTTNPGDAIAWALHVLRQAPTKRKVLVFLTDGESNVPQKLTPKKAAQLAANLSIPIYCIDASPGKPKDRAEADESERARVMMQTVARMTDGSYFRAQDGQGLAQAYEAIDRLERERILSFQYHRYHEAFHWFALAALVCFLAMVTLEGTVWRRTP